MKKKFYVKAILSVHYFRMEECIANSSASFNTGGIGNEPIVEDWIEDKDTEEIFFDI